MSQGSLKNNWWTYLWLKSETFLIVFIIANILISALTGYLTPRLIASFYDALNTEHEFKRQLVLLVALLAGEYLNRLFFTLSTHRYI